MRAALAWAPAALLGLWLAIHVAGLAAGGLWRTLAWMFALQLLPLGALPFVLGAFARIAWTRRVSWPTAALCAVGAACLWPGIAGFGLWPIRYPFGSVEDTTPSATVRLPTDAEMRVVWGGDTLATNYHQADPTQRWAYDLVVEPAGIGSARLGDYGCYGLPVLAPAAGTVTIAVDGEPDGDPAAPVTNYAAPAGNHVALALADEAYLVVAHLRPGTVRVKAGDEVAAGQVLGECGNSGNSSEPHVHLHLQRHDPARVGLVSEGLPLWFRDHVGPDGAPGRPMPLGGVAVDGASFRFVGDLVRHAP